MRKGFGSMSEQSAKGSGEGSGTHARRLWGGTRRQVVVGLIFVLLICAALFRSWAWLPGKVFDCWDNAQISEAQSWWLGHLYLPHRFWDTAVVGDRIYSHFPPMFTFLAALAVPFWDGVPYWILFALVVVPIPFLAYRLFLMRTGSVFSGVVLAVGFVCGTSLWPVIDRTLRGGAPFFVNQTLSVLGLCLFLVAYFGRRRVWLASIGLLIAGLSRQMTLAYALPLLTMAWMGATGVDRRRRLMAALVPVVLIAAAYMGLSYAKFGSPLDNGYLRIYEGRDDALARAGKTTGLFSVRYIPMNLYHVSIGPPELEKKKTAEGIRYRIKSNMMGTGIWWTTPLLLWLLVDFRRVVREPGNGPLLIAIGVIFAALMCYHSTGFAQRGYNRYSLDYVPAVLAVLAPVALKGKRRWVSLAMVGWSVVYFAWLI